MDTCSCRNEKHGPCGCAGIADESGLCITCQISCLGINALITANEAISRIEPGTKTAKQNYQGGGHEMQNIGLK